MSRNKMTIIHFSLFIKPLENSCKTQTQARTITANKTPKR